MGVLKGEGMLKGLYGKGTNKLQHKTKQTLSTQIYSQNGPKKSSINDSYLRFRILAEDLQLAS